MANWTVLQADLVRCIGGRLLAASDSDNRRLHGHSHRLPRLAPSHGRPLQMLSTSDDLRRFRPRHWVMLDDDKERDVHLFFNVVTSRFIRRRVPLLRDHVLVAGSGGGGGLLVIANREYPHAARVLNPFTGSSLRFEAAIPRVSKLRAAVAGSDENISLVFCSPILCAHPTASNTSWLPLPHTAARPFRTENASMASHRGNVYLAYRDGQVIRCSVDMSQQQRGRHCNAELIIRGDYVSSLNDPEWERRGDRSFLVTVAGELLLVCLHYRWSRWIVQAFRVDVERKAIELVWNIGRRTLFIGDRCLSVEDAGRFPSLRGNCVYRCAGKHVVCRHDLADGSEERIFGLSQRPFGLAEVFLNYCVDLPKSEAQIQIIHARNREVEQEIKG